MKIYIFTKSNYLKKHNLSEQFLINTLNKVAKETDTFCLVLALYLLPGKEIRGTAYVQNWMTRSKFTATHGKWTFTKAWEIPSDLPEKFKLIRIRMDCNPAFFPKIQTDIYGWQSKYMHFTDQLATLFAHELHHFRRHHLGLHPREGEHGANRWAFGQVQKLGFQVESKRLQLKKRRRKCRFSTILKIPDPYQNFRNLKNGSYVIISRDPGKRYTGQSATVVRPIRSNSKRMVIQTQDGKTWRWPLHWLTTQSD